MQPRWKEQLSYSCMCAVDEAIIQLIKKSDTHVYTYIMCVCERDGEWKAIPIALKDVRAISCSKARSLKTTRCQALVPRVLV